MGQKKEIEDYLFNHNDIKREKYINTNPQPKDKWSIVFEKLKQHPSFKRFLKK